MPSFKSKLISTCLLFTFLLFFGSSVVRTASTANSDDLEAPLIPNTSISGHRYAEVKINDDEDGNANNANVNENQAAEAPEAAQNRPWKVPLAQFYIGFPINGIIFAFLTSFGEDDIINIFIQAAYIMSFAICVQLYFGFYFSLNRREGSCCSFIPLIKYHRITFPSTEMDISFGRWISGPFTWIFEALTCLPDDAYFYLQSHAYFPKKPIMRLILMVQFLYYLGIWDLYRDNILRRA